MTTFSQRFGGRAYRLVRFLVRLLSVVTVRQNWGEDRVMYFDARGRLCSVLTSWTDLVEEDRFRAASAGRSRLRIDDLLQLSALVRALLQREADE